MLLWPLPQSLTCPALASLWVCHRTTRAWPPPPWPSSTRRCEGRALLWARIAESRRPRSSHLHQLTSRYTPTMSHPPPSCWCLPPLPRCCCSTPPASCRAAPASPRSTAWGPVGALHCSSACQPLQRLAGRPLAAARPSPCPTCPPDEVSHHPPTHTITPSLRRLTDLLVCCCCWIHHSVGAHDPSHPLGGHAGRHERRHGGLAQHHPPGPQCLALGTELPPAAGRGGPGQGEEEEEEQPPPRGLQADWQRLADKHRHTDTRWLLTCLLAAALSCRSCRVVAPGRCPSDSAIRCDALPITPAGGMLPVADDHQCDLPACMSLCLPAAVSCRRQQR